MNALTKVPTRNPSVAHDKVRAAWDRKMFALDRAERSYQSAEKQALRAWDLYKEGEIPKPDVKWHRFGIMPSEINRALDFDSIEELRRRGLSGIQWTFPHPPESEIDIELGKIREYRLQVELLDAKTRYTETSNASDAAYDRRWKAQTDVLLAPAPDLDALQYKLEYLFEDAEVVDTDEDERGNAWARKYTDALIADVRRLNQQSKEA